MGVQALDTYGKDDLDDLGPPPKIYELPASIRNQLMVSGMFLTLAILIFAVVVVPLTALTGGKAILFVPALMGYLFVIRRLLATPVEIAIDPRGTISIRSWLRSRTIPTGEILSVTTGGWGDPHRVRATIRHRRGRVILHNHFLDFWHFLATLKSLNPAVEIKGF